MSSTIDQRMKAQKIYRRYFRTREEAEHFIHAIEFANRYNIIVLEAKIQDELEDGELVVLVKKIPAVK